MMKRIVALLAALVLVLSLCACSKDDLGKQTQVNAGIVEYNTVVSFDYSDYLKEHEASAVKEGFANTKETTCIDKGTAKKLAINELESSFKYNTAYGALNMCLDTRRLEWNMDEHGGDMEIEYDINFDKSFLSRNKFKINVREKELKS